MSVCRPTCRCNCGYQCGGPGRCQDKDCLQKTDGQHYVPDCGHKWDGPGTEFNMWGAMVWSVTCSNCGDTKIEHDARTGP